MDATPFTQKIQKVKFQIIIRNTITLPPSSLGEQIKAKRLKSGWTGYELADFLGVSGMTIYNWENGGMIYKLKHRHGFLFSRHIKAMRFFNKTTWVDQIFNVAATTHNKQENQHRSAKLRVRFSDKRPCPCGTTNH